MIRYDVAIIGTGPAGLSAAITAKVRGMNLLLIGSNQLSNKVTKAHTIDNYLGIPGVSGRELAQAYSNHLKSMQIAITEDKVNAVYNLGEYFAIQGHVTNYEASSVILAAGMTTVKPYPGELENLGRGVSYCATCDAALYRGKEAIIIAGSAKDEAEARYLSQIADKVYYLPLYEGAFNIEDNKLEVITDAKPVSITKQDGRMKLLVDFAPDGIVADGIFIMREQIAPSQLVPGIKMDGNHVLVDRKMCTGTQGLFACGDITGTPYQYIKAAGEGNVAALSAARYLSEMTKK